MKKFITLNSFVFVVFFFGILAHAQKSALDSINELNEKYGPLDPIIEAVKTHTYKVQVVSTCSISPTQCNSEKSASTSVVKILEGEFANRYIIVASYCFHTEYKADKIYYLHTSRDQSISFKLCDGSLYEPLRNYKLKENENPLVFGELAKK